MHRTWKVGAVLGAFCVVILLLSLWERHPSIGISFSGYTNDVFGRYTFGLFRVTNGSRRYFSISQGLTELKMPEGWKQDGVNLGYRCGNVRGDEDVIVRWVGPGTNCVWRATFEFTEVVSYPSWFFKLPIRIQNWVMNWYSKPRTWLVTTEEIAPPR